MLHIGCNLKQNNWKFISSSHENKDHKKIYHKRSIDQQFVITCIYPTYGEIQKDDHYLCYGRSKSGNNKRITNAFLMTLNKLKAQKKKITTGLLTRHCLWFPGKRTWQALGRNMTPVKKESRSEGLSAPTKKTRRFTSIELHETEGFISR